MAEDAGDGRDREVQLGRQDRAGRVPGQPLAVRLRELCPTLGRLQGAAGVAGRDDRTSPQTALLLDDEAVVRGLIRPNADVCVLRHSHDAVVRALRQRRSQTRLSNVTVPDGKPHRGAVEPQNEVLAYLHTSPTDLAAGSAILRSRRWPCQGPLALTLLVSLARRLVAIRVAADEADGAWLSEVSPPVVPSQPSELPLHAGGRRFETMDASRVRVSSISWASAQTFAYDRSNTDGVWPVSIAATCFGIPAYALSVAADRRST